jgi:hypothetical protein
MKRKCANGAAAISRCLRQIQSSILTLISVAILLDAVVRVATKGIAETLNFMIEREK